MLGKVDGLKATLKHNTVCKDFAIITSAGIGAVSNKVGN